MNSVVESYAARQHQVSTTSCNCKRKGAVKWLKTYIYSCGGVTAEPQRRIGKFRELICQYGADKIMQAAVFLYAANDGSPKILLKKIRQGTVDNWLKQLPEIDEKTRLDYEAVKACFMAEIAEVGYSKLAAHV